MGEFVADKDYFADKDGNLVEANDPNKVTKVVGVGGTLSSEDAARYGLGASSDEASSDAADSGEHVTDASTEPKESGEGTAMSSKKSARKARK